MLCTTAPQSVSKNITCTSVWIRGIMLSDFDIGVLDFPSSHPHQVEQKLAPKVNHPAPRILDFAAGRLGEDTLLEVVRDLVAQLVLHLQLDLFLVERIDHVRLHRVIAQKTFVTLIELPERLIGPLPVDPK